MHKTSFNIILFSGIFSLFILVGLVNESDAATVGPTPSSDLTYYSKCTEGKMDAKYENWMGTLVSSGSSKDDGFYRHYNNNASILCHEKTGANEVHGDIRTKYSKMNWEWSFLGFPITDELDTVDGVGRFNDFQGGSIYWHPDTGAHEVHGLIYQKWKDLGAVGASLHYPITDELDATDSVGRFNDFQGGSIYWHPDTGAHEVHGPIYLKWKDIGGEKSYLGYPITDEVDQYTVTDMGVFHDSAYSNFEGGVICWNPSDGTKVIQGGSGLESCQEVFAPEQGDDSLEPIPDVPSESGDGVKPFLVVPSNMVTKATSSEGVKVDYVTTAIDDVDGELEPSCSPESGSLFEIGDTKVTCMVSDSSGNIIRKSFLITVEPQSLVLPSWIRDVAGFWCTDTIDDTTFLEAIQYLLQNNLIIVPGAEASGEASEGQVPSWIKNLACFWSQEQVSDGEFASAIKYLLEEGIITFS